QNFDRTACLLDRLDRRLGSAVDRELDLGLELAAAQELHAALGAPHQAGFHQSLDRDRAIRVDPAGIDRRLDLADIDLVELDRKRSVAEAALGQAAVQRHLAALEPLDAHAGTRGLALAAAAAGLAHAGADAAADAHAILARARIVGDLVQFHRCVLDLSFAMAGLLSPPSTYQPVDARHEAGHDAEYYFVSSF